MHDEVYCVFVIVVCVTALAMQNTAGLIVIGCLGLGLALAARRSSRAVEAPERPARHDIPGRG
jgi:hypothetical protein